MVEPPAAGLPDAGSEAEPQAAEQQHPVRGAVALLVLLAPVALLVYRVYPNQHPLQKNPNFIDVIFANNLVLFAARLVLLSAAGVLAVAAIFMVISFWKRGKAGHWMSKFGPLETQAFEDLRGAVEQWQGWWEEEFDRRTELEERVEQSDQLIADLNTNYQAALVEIARLKEEL